MFVIAIITLALVAGQVVTLPPAFTLNDDVDQGYTGTLDEGEEANEIISIVKPFEMTNPDRVAAGDLYQSDMLLSEEQWEALRSRKAIDDETRRWSEGTDGYPLVPYVFQDSVDQNDVRAALDHWMEHTCIKFEKTWKTDQPHLQFYIGQECSSAVGMSWNNGQPVSIGPNCNRLGVVVHEVGHAIGFFHEQSRSDRDDYVTILMENVINGKEDNFEKATDNINNYGIPYDYSSVMHYGMDLFSNNNKPTLVTKDPMAQELIGSRKGLTHRDKLLANRMYNCIGKWLKKCGISSDPCLNDGYTGKDCKCICPPGTSGSNCEKVVGDYYDQLRNPLSEKITTEKSITIETPMDAGNNFVKWIVPPSCKKAKLTFTSANMLNNCQAQNLNVKTNSKDVVGQTMCAADVSAGVSLTSKSGIIITMINYVNYGFKITLWEADVKFIDIPGCTATNPPTQPPTKPSASIVACEKKPKVRTLPKGTSVTITSPNFPSEYSGTKCGWKLKAPKKSLLTISCDEFALNGKDNLKIAKKSFKGKNAPSLSLRNMPITFRPNKKSSGPGFRCTVVSK